MNIIENFLTTQQNIRMYHWTTKIYNQHVISGKLYEKLDELFDKFVETYLGKYENLNYKKLKILSNYLSDKEFIEFLKRFKQFLMSELEFILSSDDMKNSDLKNIRDEILGEINQVIFLLKMK